MPQIASVKWWVRREQRWSLSVARACPTAAHAATGAAAALLSLATSAPQHTPTHTANPTPSHPSLTAPHPAQTGIPVLGVVENMAGLRQPLSSFKLYSPAGQDITAAVLAAAAAHAGGGGGGGADGDAGGGVMAETAVFHASGGGAAKMAADMQVCVAGNWMHASLQACSQLPERGLAPLPCTAGRALRAAQQPAPAPCSSRASPSAQHIPHPLAAHTPTGAIPGKRTSGCSAEPRR